MRPRLNTRFFDSGRLKAPSAQNDIEQRGGPQLTQGLPNRHAVELHAGLLLLRFVDVPVGVEPFLGMGWRAFGPFGHDGI